MSSPARTRRPATYEDLLAVPDHLIAEILDGELHTTPRPALPHAVVTSHLSGDLESPFVKGRGGPGGWWILYEPEIHLANDILVPDLAGSRRERLPQVPRTAYMTLSPDWVCETLSPSTESIDRGKKLRIYAREGVRHVWLINPDTETIEVFRLEKDRWLLLDTYAGDISARLEPFDAIELELWWLWGRSEPR
jgi:Uma2 family endonuclease